jgi:hypothetical protein
MLMRQKIALAVITVAIAIAFAFSVPRPTSNAKNVRTPVVVELFTSEGCSSCPQADHLLVQLQQQHMLDNAELILLAEHVDYWDNLGWKDRFSSAAFTARQGEYARSLGLPSAYTPQAVVDGHIDVLGSDQRSLERAILLSASNPKPAQVALKWTASNLLNVSVDNAATGRILLAVTEDELTTNVGAGENGGNTLHHSAVVRELRDLGLANKGTYQSDVKLEWRPDWKRDHARAIVLVQRENGEVFGAASLKP